MPPAYEFRGNDRRSNNHHHPRHEFTFRYARPSTSERPLLRSRREVTPDQLRAPGSTDEKPALKFARLENLSDSEEADMDVSSADEDEAAHPRKKRAVDTNGTGTATAAPAPAPAPIPKWSNPDPYTALPPPDETTSKRVDVVKLIRKARIAATAAQPAEDPVKSNEDFISLSGMVDDDDDKQNPPDGAPTGPRRQMDGRDSAFGSRKRTYDDEIKGTSKKTGKPLSKYYDDGSIIDEWRARPSENGTPWLGRMEPSLHLGTRLHNEMLSFYHWVKPVYYEQIVREDLVARLQSAFQSRYYGVQLRPFGSFASGLYLPTADIDLVLLSTNFMRSGIKTFGERKGQIYAFSAFIKNLNIAVPNSIEAIAHARVPILKFVDKMTGLRVDLSFDNDSGLVANETFQQWKAEYPAMPVVVSVIKQFLLLRGLNEVPTGGLGGFSITCLVTSLLQHLPHGHTTPNLGSILMDFFEFYGNRFDYDTVGIRLDPPGYFNKKIYQQSNNNPRLSIEDPNNADNDISGGTREIALIFRAFSDAYRRLKARMVSTAMSGTPEASILDTIIAANYDEYAEQRWQLREIFDSDPRFARLRRPSSPPLPPQAPPPPVATAPPPPPVRSNSPPTGPKSRAQREKATKQQKKQQAARERAARLKRLRPDIPSIPYSINNDQALSLGGYATQSDMDRDLIMREKGLAAPS
ncbi:putative topoisomerase family protein TRF4 [Aspergillus heteromorphus CBS 117.55]|uniref:polynucleotide adenylyltransferase n=1 Tax=Aspergillus heteromorphus CBS 117.55 TaxID=1448321 RepID=A0A317V681_9EURO|nr:putative topoisomerase family protein TRF4 [Aspergillus heteromorphus CBS 117.55]PWY69566.1 putative topoisomerase family protein TRF4 [Aspergillus heteromorphus CBS 117.55]